MNVYLSPQAKYKLDLILIYILERWNTKVRNEFVNILIEKINQISAHPKSCPVSNINKDVYKCVLAKQITFFYRMLIIFTGGKNNMCHAVDLIHVLLIGQCAV